MRIADELIHPSRKVAGVLGYGCVVLAYKLIHLPDKPVGVLGSP